MKLLDTIILSALFASASLVSALGVRHGQIKNIVTFGDSYTDIVLAGDNGSEDEEPTLEPITRRQSEGQSDMTDALGTLYIERDGGSRFFGAGSEVYFTTMFSLS